MAFDLNVYICIYWFANACQPTYYKIKQCVCICRVLSLLNQYTSKSSLSNIICLSSYCCNLDTKPIILITAINRRDFWCLMCIIIARGMVSCGQGTESHYIWRALSNSAKLTQKNTSNTQLNPIKC